VRRESSLQRSRDKKKSGVDNFYFSYCLRM